MYHFITRVLFVIGFLIGILLAVLIIKLTENKSSHHLGKTKTSNGKVAFNSSIYESWFASKNLLRQKLSFDVLRYSSRKIITESQYLFEKIKILCLILVRNLKNAEASSATWGKNCNKMEYLHISIDNKKRKIVPIKKTKNNSSWVLLCKALVNVSDNYNWILILHDDTFAILENLRLLVAGLDDSKGYYLGHPVTFWTVTYNMGQAGFVLSKGSVNKIKNKFNMTNSCTSERTYWNQEDMYLGKYFQDVFERVTEFFCRKTFSVNEYYANRY